MKSDKQELMTQLQRIRDEHRSVDDRLKILMRETIVDPFTIQNLKKKKLSLKDQIAKLEDFLYPDIIA
ncbi:MAG: DUF465 domain-containing protein [Alphaproteobacteria bacterium]|nr:DUF465 domain-containing protein [Alphaproteobacteria bacterium]